MNRFCYRRLRRLSLTGLTFLLSTALISCAALQRPDLERYSDYAWPDTSEQDSVQPRIQSSVQSKSKTLTVTFLGTTSLYFNDGETGLLIDGFLTRPGNLLQLLLGEIVTDQALVERSLKRLGIQDLDALLVSHSHYDHAMDAGTIAQLTGAQLLGSRSTVMIGKGANLPDQQLTEVQTGVTYIFGKFRVTFLESKHVPLPGLLEVTGMMEEIQKPLRQPASLYAYAEGMTYAILIEHPDHTSLLHSGAFLPDELKGRQADTLFLATPGLPKLKADEQAQFYQEIVRGSGAKLVLPVHWDDFTLPLESPLKPMPRFAEDLDAAMQILIKWSKREPGFTIRFLPVWQAVPLTSVSK